MNMFTRLIIVIISVIFWSEINAQTVDPEVHYVEGSSEKICQLVGDHDNQFSEATENLTLTHYGLWGTDLGIPFIHDGKTFVLFGDVPGSDRDPIAYTDDTVPEDGISLSFITNPDGSYKPISIPGISQGAFEVPTEGLSIDGKMYVYHTTNNMSKSVLARSEDNGSTFTLVEPEISTNHFINLSIEKVNNPDWQGLPVQSGSGLVIFGSGQYRQSNVFLAFQPTESMEYKESLRYFSGLDASQNPVWSSDETEAKSLFNQSCVGEFSVSYNRFIEKWIMLYNCDLAPHPRGILFRTADKPWGPWSESQILFDPWVDKGYCFFMHVSWDYTNCDDVHDPGRANEWGGEYGPYQFDELATGTDSTTTIYYTLSTWNPYTVVLMKSILKKPSGTSSTNHLNENHLVCFPNPATNSVTLRFSPGKLPESIVIFDSIGKQNIEYLVDKSEIIIDTTEWESGVYFIRLKYKNGDQTTDKFMKY